MKHSLAPTASRSKKSTTKVIALVILTGVLLYGKFSSVLEKREKNIESNTDTPVSMIFVGDIMFDRGVRRSVETHFSSNYDALYTHAQYINEADIAFGNLEGPVGENGKRVGSRFSFHMDPEGLLALKRAGMDVVSFSNNHVGDYGYEGFNETLGHLKSIGMGVTGAGTNIIEAHTPYIIEVKGVRIGYLAATDVGPNWMKATKARSGIALIDEAFMNAIRNADSTVDVLVVSIHFGDEYSPVSTRQRTVAHRVVDSGADIVVGHHPHVMQAMEMYKEKPIFYSLGNYIFDQYFSPHTMQGMVAKVTYDKNTKELSKELFVSVQNKQFIPQPLTQFSESLLVKKRFTP